MNSYWFAHRALNSKAKAVYGDIYQLSQIAPRSDIVIIGQILVHIRDPLEVLRHASLLAGERLIIIEGSFESEQPSAVFLGGKGNYYSWWHLSVQFYREYLDILGFEVVRANKGRYHVDHPDVPQDVEVWTIVAERRR